MKKIGVLHPGEMGISIAVSAQNNGYQVCWVSEDRSQKTKSRAEKHVLIDLTSLANLCETCDVILSVCPPNVAEDVADQVIGQGFKGLYLDANAISPQRARMIGDRMESTGIEFVDGGIIGGPAWNPTALACIFLERMPSKSLTYLKLARYEQKLLARKSAGHQHLRCATRLIPKG